MKTLNNLKQYFPVVSISLVLIALTIGVNAQNRRIDDKKEKDRDREKKEYRQPDRYQETDDNSGWRDRNDGNHNYRNYESGYTRDKYQANYSKKNNHAKYNYSDHPKYGRVYSRFEHNPLVFKNQYGDYYYSGNNFYKYHKGIGYGVVEPPRHVYFRHLPDNYERVYVNGSMFYRTSNLFFQLSPRGYVLVPSPIQLRITARF